MKHRGNGRLGSGNSWVVFDQAIYMTSNGLLGITAANLLAIRQVGALAIAVSVILMGLLFSRAVLLDPYLIEKGRGGADAVGLLYRRALILGVTMGALIAASAPFWDGQSKRIVLILSVALPPLCLQDAARYVAIASGSPKRAAAMDGLWVAGALLVWALLGIGLVEPTPVVLLAGWAVCGAFSSLLCLHQARLRGPINGRAWGQKVILMSGPLLMELLLGSLLVLVVPVEISLLSSMDEAGLYRTVMTLQGPLGALAAGLVLANRAQSAALMKDRSILAMRVVIRLAGTVAGAAFLWTFAAVVLPASIGDRLFREVWSGIAPLFLPAGLQVVAGSLTMPLGMMLTSVIGIGKSYLRLRLLAGAMLVAAVAVGATQAGARGALIGQGLTNLLLSGLLWRAFSRRISHRGPSQPVRPMPA